MPKRKVVPSLEELSMKAVGRYVTCMGQRLIGPICCHSFGDPNNGAHFLQSNIDYINTLLISSVPYYLYDRLAIEVLQAVQELIEKTKKTFNQFSPMTTFVNEMNVVVSLTESVINAHLKTLDFTCWPKMMRYVLYKCLRKMSGLEKLNLGSCLGGWSNHDKWFLDALGSMKNLHTLCLCFDCTDLIVQILGDNCPKLQNLDITSSRSVTERSVPSLLKCKDLKELQLCRTSMSIAGYAQLLIGLPKLQDLGRCDEFGSILKYIYNLNPSAGPFEIRKFQSRDITTEHLKLLVYMCPNLYHVSIFHDEQIWNITLLTVLQNLTELKLLSCDFYTDNVKQLLEIKGSKITSLHLEHVEEIDLNALMYISQFCPKLKNLVLYNCDFLAHTSLFANPDRLRVKPFQQLERIFCVADSASLHLEFLLTHCVNIKNIHLGSSTGIGHDLMIKILNRNPMRHLEELRILYSSDLSICTVDKLLASCPKLRVLSELESWNSITKEELAYFKEYIEKSNFALDIRPTLSY